MAVPYKQPLGEDGTGFYPVLGSTGGERWPAGPRFSPRREFPHT